MSVSLINTLNLRFSMHLILFSEVLSTFRIIPEQSLRFLRQYIICSKYIYPLWWVIYRVNLLQCATPVVSYLVRYKIQHTAHLSPCGILNLVSGFCIIAYPNSLTMQPTLLCLVVGYNHYTLVFTVQQFCVQRYELLLICLSPIGSEIYPFGPVPTSSVYCHCYDTQIAVDLCLHKWTFVKRKVVGTLALGQLPNLS